MVNYDNGKIYKIEHVNGEGDVYIGSTTKEYLSQRMDSHRRDYKQWKAGKRDLTTSYQLFEKYGVENCNIVLLEYVQAQSKDELHAREAFWIRTVECVNKFIPGRSAAEHYQDNKQEYLQKMKERYQDNKQEVLQKQKQYRENNKEEINQKKKEDMICPCGSTVRISDKARHERSQKHQQFIKSAPVSVEAQDE